MVDAVILSAGSFKGSFRQRETIGILHKWVICQKLGESLLHLALLINSLKC